MTSPAASDPAQDRPSQPPPAVCEAVLVVNTRSRQGETCFQDARKQLVAAGIRLTAAHAVRDPAHLVATVRSAVQSGAPMVIVGGGDGTVSGTVDEMVGYDCVFALLPLGTANSFARTLGLPLDLPSAVATIAAGHRRRIDLGMIDSDYFANAATLGLSPMIGRTVPHELKRYLGRVGYLVWAIRCFLRFRPFQIVVDDGEQVHRLWTTEVRIFNGRFHGGVELVETTDVDSGDMVIQAVTGQSRLRMVRDWYAKFFRLRSRDDTTVEFRGSSLRLEARPRQAVSIDGEVLARTPLTVSIARKAIEVVAPAPSAR